MKEMFLDVWSDGWVGKLIVSFFLCAILAMPFLCWGAVLEVQRWEEFKIEHECKIVGKKNGQTFVGTGIGANGSVTTTIGGTSSQTGWLCNDGVTYWR